MKIVETMLPKGKIVEIIELEDGTYKVVQEVEEAKDLNDTFVLIEASRLSLDDDFMNFNPKRDKIKSFKDALSEVIKKGVKDFYRPIMDPSFTEDGISFEAGEKPAVDKLYDWWKKAAKDFMPNRGSRLGTRSEYIAFLGVLIKELVNQGWTKEKAWKAVCIDSTELGHYWDYKEEKHDFELTGSREVVGLYDLANTYKILTDDNSETFGFWLAGGSCYTKGKFSPLATLNYYARHTNIIVSSVGWFVLEV